MTLDEKNNNKKLDIAQTGCLILAGSFLLTIAISAGIMAARPNVRAYDQVLYQTRNDSLTLYEPRTPETWQEHSAAISPEYLIGTVAKSDIKYKNKSKNMFGRNVAVKVLGNYNGLRSLVEQTLSMEEQEKQDSLYNYKKTIPEFTAIKKVVVYNAENKDLFFKPAVMK